ncbi:heavy metal-associated isoprenylated plant protein 32-like [Zingiber officinale]|uniref:HMA domain-containing protein n=1 Tax=Zingiber officinale TaxID=94328 RepID=A0A8J5E840_ZINOF|nr:heavy metal-associated isoprenylated plant protein 32-like [Zingiber officinale]KAG6466214.1 hypothetical protein ZIOFF_075999 [Zingiber officinale]
MMNKEEGTKFLTMQTCTLKVNIHCDGCKKKVKKLLHKVDGVYTTSIDAEGGKVTVSGNVDPAALLKKLAKAGKHAELLAPKAGNNNQAQKPQQQPEKQGGKRGNGSGGNGKDQKVQHPKPTPQQQQQQQFRQHLQQQQKMKAPLPQMKPLNFPPQKDLKSVDFKLPPKGCQGYDDEEDEVDFEEEGDLDEDDMDEFDCFDADFDEDFKSIKIKPAISTPKAKAMMADKAKKGDRVPPVQSKAVCNSIDRKNGKKGGGAKPQDNKSSANGGAEKFNLNGHDINITKKMQGKNGVVGSSVSHPMANPGMAGHGNFPAGKMQVPAVQVGNIPAVARGAGPAPGYYQGGALAPPSEVIAAAAAVNPYQQQYMAAMIQQQQQQQRMMMMMQDRPAFQPTMAYARTPPVTMYNMHVPPLPATYHTEPFTTFFSDENASGGCSIM